jgi:hypothetical protein
MATDKAKHANKSVTPRRSLDECLDEALSFTFPASDPIAVGGEEGAELVVQRRGPRAGSRSARSQKRRRGAS